MKDTFGMIVAAVLVVALGFGAYWWWNKDGGSTIESPYGTSSIATTTTPGGDEPYGPVSTEVSFTATDGYVLSGTYSVPLVGSPIKVPVLILVHQQGTNRHDFDDLRTRLLDDGYAVLAYDSRGAGVSTSTSIMADKKDYMKDFSGAVNFLSSQKEVDASALGVLGAGVGGNVAFVASGTFPAVKVAVALSPTSTGMPKELLGTAVAGFAPRALLVVSDEKGKAEADLVYKKVSDPKDRKVYTGAGTGVMILRNDSALQDISAFIAQFLDLKG